MGLPHHPAAAGEQVGSWGNFSVTVQKILLMVIFIFFSLNIMLYIIMNY